MFKILALLILLNGQQMLFETKDAFPDLETCKARLETEFNRLDETITKNALPVREMRLKCAKVGPSGTDA